MGMPNAARLSSRLALDEPRFGFPLAVEGDKPNRRIKRPTTPLFMELKDAAAQLLKMQQPARA
jgi:hypothetical protein